MQGDKKTAQLRLPTQLRHNAETALDVRLLAEYEHRSLQDEMRHIFTLGLDQKIAQVGNETMRTLRRAVSLGEAEKYEFSGQIGAEPKPARQLATRRDSARHGATRNEESAA